MENSDWRKERRQHGGSIKMVGDKIYARIQYRDASGRRQEKLRRATSRKEARALVKQMRAELENHGTSILRADKLRFAELAEKYSGIRLVPAVYSDGRKAAGKRSLGPSRSALPVLVTHFSRMQIRSIKPSDVEAFKVKRLAQPVLVEVKVKTKRERRWNYLQPGATRRGVMSWSHGGNVTASVSILVDLGYANPYMELDYRVNSTPVKYRVCLVSLPSNLGNGIVWYFLCPETEKRCRKLYLSGTRFLHRKAVKGAMYSDQTRSKRWRTFGAILQFLKLDERCNKKYAKTHYKGKPTKRHVQFLRRAQRVLEKANSNPLFG